MTGQTAVPAVDRYQNVALNTSAPPQEYNPNAAEYSPDLDKSNTGEYLHKPISGYDKSATLGEIAIDVEAGETPNATELMRTSSWINTFFLITTDILGMY